MIVYKGCRLDVGEIEKDLERLWDIAHSIEKDAYIGLEEDIDLTPFYKNSIDVRIYKDLADLINNLSKLLDVGYIYINRFDIPTILDKLPKGLLAIGKDIDFFRDVDKSLSHIDFVSLDTASLFSIEDRDQTNTILYCRELHLLVSRDRIFKDFISAFKVSKLLIKFLDGEYILRIISSPSRTGDIEKVIVYGAHGPRKVYLHILDSNNYSPYQQVLRYISIKYWEEELCLRRSGYTLDPMLIHYGYRIPEGLVDIYSRFMDVDIK